MGTLKWAAEVCASWVGETVMRAMDADAVAERRQDVECEVEASSSLTRRVAASAPITSVLKWEGEWCNAVGWRSWFYMSSLLSIGSTAATTSKLTRTASFWWKRFRDDYYSFTHF
jgi:hypothetical protein